MGDRQQLAAAAMQQQPQQTSPAVQQMQGGYGLSPSFIQGLMSLSKPGGMFSPGTGVPGITGSTGTTFGGVDPQVAAVQKQIQALSQLQQLQNRPVTFTAMGGPNIAAGQLWRQSQGK